MLNLTMTAMPMRNTKMHTMKYRSTSPNTPILPDALGTQLQAMFNAPVAIKCWAKPSMMSMNTLTQSGLDGCCTEALPTLSDRCTMTNLHHDDNSNCHGSRLVPTGGLPTDAPNIDQSGDGLRSHREGKMLPDRSHRVTTATKAGATAATG